MQIASEMLWYRSTIPRDEWSVDVDRARVTIAQNARVDGNISSTSTHRSDTSVISSTDQDATLIWYHYGQQFFFLFYFSLSFPFEIESRISLAERDASKKSNSPFCSEGRRGKLEGEKLCSFMSFFVKKCERDGCIIHDHLYPIKIELFNL